MIAPNDGKTCAHCGGHASWIGNNGSICNKSECWAEEKALQEGEGVADNRVGCARCESLNPPLGAWYERPCGIVCLPCAMKLDWLEMERLRRAEVGCQARREDPTGSRNPRETDRIVPSERDQKTAECIMMLVLFCILMFGVLAVLKGCGCV